MNDFFTKYRPLFNTPEGNAGGGAPDPAPPVAPPPAPQAPQAPAWISPTLPQEARDYLISAEYGKNETPEAALIHLSQLATAAKSQGVLLNAPKGADDAAAYDAIYKALGRPEAADKYEIKYPDGYTPNEKLTAFAKEASFKLGADGSKAQALVDGFLAVEKEIVESRVAEVNAANAAAMADLEKSFGAELAKAKADGARAMQAMGLPEETLAFFDQNKGSAHIARVLAVIGKGMGEGGGFVGSTGSGQTPAQALQALTDFQNSESYKEVAKLGPRHPKYREVMDELNTLGAKAYPSRRA